MRESICFVVFKFFPAVFRIVWPLLGHGAVVWGVRGVLRICDEGIGVIGLIGLIGLIDIWRSNT